MSTKLQDLTLHPYNGKLVLSKRNKRGSVKDYIDISTPVIQTVLKLLITSPDKYIYQEISDPETGKVKRFKITCTEMTSEETNIYLHNQKVKKQQSLKYTSMFNMILNFFGKNNFHF